MTRIKAVRREHVEVRRDERFPCARFEVASFVPGDEKNIRENQYRSHFERVLKEQ